MSMSQRKNRSIWWTITVVRCAFVVVAMTLTFPPCMGLEPEDNASSDDPVSFYWAEVNFIYRDPGTGKQMTETAVGKYGEQSLVEQRTGLVTHVHDIEKKSHGCKEYTNKIPQVPWIALIERGDCLFTMKIEMATQTYNASAVIIYNHDEEGITIMKHKVKTQVSIFVSQKTGKKLAKLSDSGVKVKVTIIPGRKESSYGNGSCNSIGKTSALTSFIVPLVLSLAWLVFGYM